MAVLHRVVELAAAPLELAVLVFEANIAAGDDLDGIDVGADRARDPAVAALGVLLFLGLQDDSIDTSERDPQLGTLQSPLNVTFVTIFFICAVFAKFAHHYK